MKQIALRTNENIQTMIKDLFHSPPIYKASVTLSFKVASNLKEDIKILNLSNVRSLLHLSICYSKQERSKSDSGPAAKAGEKRKPITFYSASEGTGAKQGRTGNILFAISCFLIITRYLLSPDYCLVIIPDYCTE